MLLIEPPLADGYPLHPERYPGATRVQWAGRLHEPKVRAWLRGLSTVYAAETLYDARLARWAADEGVRTVVHVNPEFHRPSDTASTWWAPTSWRLDTLPPGTTVVPFPVATDRWPHPAKPHDGPCRWVHVVGKRALADRNGTGAVLAALPHLRERCAVEFVVQDPAVAVVPRDVPEHIDVRVSPGVDDYWALYHGADALVLPRRYGGLSLPCQEAMGAGLAVLMTDAEPNRDWPVATVRALLGPFVAMPCGEVEVAKVDPLELAVMMDAFADPAYRAQWQAKARAWADAHSWTRWTEKYRELLA